MDEFHGCCGETRDSESQLPNADVSLHYATIMGIFLLYVCLNLLSLVVDGEIAILH